MEKKKVQLIAESYYSRKDIQQAIYDFCKNRETVPSYMMEAFGKRPDMLDYPSDILNSAKNGATSFHCSEELWSNPLEISKEFSEKQYNDLRIGWDFLIDIDSKYLDYSKIAAKLIIQALEYHDVKNIGIKFSGSKGFHIIIPFKAFPSQVGDELTKDNFPEWPRYIAAYVSDMIHDKLIQEILKLSTHQDIQKSSKQEKQLYEIIYKPTGEIAQSKTITNYVCLNPSCRTQMQSTSTSNRKKLRCPSCNYDMEKQAQQEVYVASSNKDTSQKNPDLFEKKATAKELIDSVDIVLVASRHLFRAPYSLHEKTSKASIVINKDEIQEFKPADADPLKVKTRSFYPENVQENEAKELLMQALDWAKHNQLKTKELESSKKKFTGKSIDLKGLTITEDMFPPIIKKILKGIKDDGRKRALYLLLSFLTSLEFPREYIEQKISEWNKKNYKPLKQGYIKSQITWFSRTKIMPPNYDKPIYKEFQAPELTSFRVQLQKNPINYTIKLAMQAKSRKKYKKQKQENESK